MALTEERLASFNRTEKLLNDDCSLAENDSTNEVMQKVVVLHRCQPKKVILGPRKCREHAHTKSARPK
ncbi:hypothetical protein RB195_005633 [Necator americanus]|uniref:Uncharacterized protein n=1 Tax=Necator americanus TaxID=51031 RepID=A0ABR1BSR4_NECAM